MQISTYSDYALRLLMKLAVEPDRLSTIREVAEAYGISRNHLMKVAQELARHGYVQSVRGRAGGLRLARAPEAINVGEVVRRTEESFVLVECFDPERNRCVITPACGLRHALAEALAAFLAVLDSYSLADLVGDRALMTQLITRSRPSPALP